MKSRFPTVVPFAGLVALACLLVVGACAPDTLEGPVVDVQDHALVEAGEPLYAANCASCHGTDLRGTDVGPSHLSILYEPGHHSDFAFLQAVRFGSQPHHWSFGPMPAIAGLSDEEVEAITAYVRESQRLEGFESYPPP